MDQNTQQQKPISLRRKIGFVVGTIAIIIFGYFGIRYGLAEGAYRSAVAQYAAKDYQRAAELAGRATRLYPFPQWTAKNAYLLLVQSLIGNGYYSSGDKERSLALFRSAQDAARRAQKLYPQEARFLVLEVSSRRIPTMFGDYSAYNWEEITALLDRAAALDPQLTALQFERGLFYFARADYARAWDESVAPATLQGWLEQAKTNLENVLQQEPNFAAAHLFLAHVLENLGAPEAALQHAKQYVGMQPEDPYGYLLQGTSLARLGSKSAPDSVRRDYLLRALDSLLTAIRLNPQFPLVWEAWNNLAATQNMLGAYADARESAERAIKEAPADLLKRMPNPYKHLGDAYAGLYAKSGSRDYYEKAVEAYQTALRLNPQYYDAQTALSSLQVRAR